MIIEVTKDDITNGEPCVPRACPISLAMTRAIGIQVVVGKISAFAEYTQGFILPKQAVEFIERFDHCREVEPFTFEL